MEKWNGVGDVLEGEICIEGCVEFVGVGGGVWVGFFVVGYFGECFGGCDYGVDFFVLVRVWLEWCGVYF